MTGYTETEIARLISCQKTIKDAPRRDMKEENRHRRNDLTVVSAEGEDFDVFIRQSLEFAEDFSLGLVYRTEDGRRILLVRYNGQHEQSPQGFAGHPHYAYHIHRATAENLDNGRYEKHPASITEAYASFDETIGAFMQDTGIQGWDKYFPNSATLPLFQSNGA